MIKRITPAELRIGMYIRKFEGSWLDHPFWRSRFAVSDAQEIATIRESGIAGLYIDTELGADVAPPVLPPPPPEPSRDPGLRIEAARAELRTAAAHSARIAPAGAPSAPKATATMAEEFARAAKLVEQSKRAIVRTFGDARLGKAVQGGKLIRLVDRITGSIARNQSAILSIARLKSAHEYTYMHSVAVCALMINLGRQMRLPEEQVRELGLAGLLHDIGKMAVPAELLDKAGKLSDDEFAMVRGHARAGHELLARSEGVPEAALDVSLHHHERVDGTGYPDALMGDRLSIAARMGAICDVYDAVTSDRAYKTAWGAGDALKQMAGWAGHFDPEILDTFSKSIGIYPVGGLVRLKSGRLAVVTDENAREPMRPPLTAFYCTDGRRLIAPEPVAWSSDEIVELDRPERWDIEGWETLRGQLIARAA